MMDFEIEPKLIEIGVEKQKDDIINFKSKEISPYDTKESIEKRKDI